ncbi:hypothetical protein [Erythrobacter sp. HL-111]|uniref:hypothetical protein n=1 Tax=Erythrobacter sp. HL-111 TaxID=1798193 RepID=UPI0006D9D7FF|nr:hypothetical protein [Erythrobacter sp. HL-111]KPP92938.1 MAG: hypothetical protein HLUCCO15_07260 [Erythrobacteraceae bacterium HL-111]SDT02678.1 hypothetical protein SAMN04515621_2746 [Erythrobacter sp. HL-111]
MFSRILSSSRFNPKAGALDFWHEFRKPNPYRWPILAASCLPLAVIFGWLSTETHYKEPARPTITYITTFDPERTDEEIMASNRANQEVKELREERAEAIAERKRELYKALGRATGMDVDEIERRAEAERAAEEAATAERRAAGADPAAAPQDRAEGTAR